MIIFLPWSMKWNWVTLWIVLSRFSTHHSHIVDRSLVWCMLLTINNKNDIRMRVWLETSTYKKIVHFLVFLSKTIWELYSLFTSIMYKLMGNGGLWTWMHLYNCIMWTLYFDSCVFHSMASSILFEKWFFLFIKKMAWSRHLFLFYF